MSFQTFIFIIFVLLFIMFLYNNPTIMNIFSKHNIEPKNKLIKNKNKTKYTENNIKIKKSKEHYKYKNTNNSENFNSLSLLDDVSCNSSFSD